jgi:multidrug efflux system membrane fusion protein
MKPSFGFLRHMRASHVIAVGLAVAATAWVASGAMSEKNTEVGVKPAAKVEPQPVLVRVRESRAEPHERFATLFGRSEAVKSIEVAAETAGRIVERPVKKGDLVNKGDVIVRLAIDDRQAKLKEAEAKVEFQELSYDSAKKLSQKQFSSKIKVAEELSKLESAKAALAAVRLDVQRTAVRAPITAYIETLPANVGDYVEVGDKVSRLVDLDPIRVVAQVAERQVMGLKTGEQAWVLLPGGRTHQGEVRFISKIGEAKTRTFRVEIWFDNKEGAIPEGLTAEVRLKTGAAAAHKVSPATVTLDDQGAIGVKAVDAEGRVKFHAVEVVEDTTEGMWIAGLPATLTLITVGQEFVRPGEKVRTKSGAEASAK